MNFLLKLIGVFVWVLVSSAQNAQVAVRSVAAKGILKCGQNPAADVKVVLFRINSKDENEILDSRLSGPTGMFEINANTNGRRVNETELNPVVRFYHRCDVAENKKKGSFRSFQIGIPKEQITLGKLPKKTFDFGKMNLELTYPKESWEKERN